MTNDPIIRVCPANDAPSASGQIVRVQFGPRGPRPDQSRILTVEDLEESQGLERALSAGWDALPVRKEHVRGWRAGLAWGRDKSRERRNRVLAEPVPTTARELLARIGDGSSREAIFGRPYAPAVMVVAFVDGVRTLNLIAGEPRIMVIK